MFTYLNDNMSKFIHGGNVPLDGKKTPGKIYGGTRRNWQIPNDNPGELH